MAQHPRRQYIEIQVMIYDCDDRNIVVSQNTLNLMKVERDPDSVCCVTSFHYGNQLTDLKVEEEKHIVEEEDPLLIKFPQLKAEHEVSNIHIYLLSSETLPVCPST
jgi:RNA binding exosome subunit